MQTFLNVMKQFLLEMYKRIVQYDDVMRFMPCRVACTRLKVSP